MKKLLISLCLFPTFAVAEVNLSQYNINFGKVSLDEYQVNYETVKIQNISDEDLKLEINHNCSNEFNISDDCYFALGKYQSCRLRIEYRPRFENYHSCQIQLRPEDDKSTWRERINVRGQAYKEK